MDTQTLIIFSILIIGAVVSVGYYLSSQLKKSGKSEDTVLVEWLKEMKGTMEKNTEVMERQLKDQRTTIEEQMKNHRDTLSQQTKFISERLEKSSDVIREVQKQLGGIQEFGTDMKDLSNILKSPKLRGGLGEQFLYEILENFLPKDLFKTQYKFKDGSVCDAVVFTDRGIIPIDSKFPMENFKAMITADTQVERDRFKKTFNNDVKKRIDEISSKYILPEEKTTEQAIMYVPSENVYYELIVNTPEIEDYAKNKNIIMASPNTLSYFLKVLLVAYQQHELQKHTGEILKALAGIKVEAGKFNEDLSVLERHISNSYKSMDGVKSRYSKLFGRIEKAQAIEKKVEEEPKLLE
ncbi:DNA recombination protein RmuC [Patescibacteria group bacterium]|nr:DNA recombination protein RmuC [Patescibacteria group bacterium]